MAQVLTVVKKSKWILRTISLLAIFSIFFVLRLAHSQAAPYGQNPFGTSDYSAQGNDTAVANSPTAENTLIDTGESRLLIVGVGTILVVGASWWVLFYKSKKK